MYLKRQSAAAGLCILIALVLLLTSCGEFGLRTTDTIVTWAGTGVEGYSGDGGPADEAQIAAPWGLVVDAAGNLYFSDRNNSCVRRVDPDGLITVVAGRPGDPGFSGDGGQATDAELSGPLGLALDGDGDLVIVDGYNHRVRSVDTATGIITTIAGSGTEGFSGDGGAAADASLAWPQDVAFDSAGNLYIADTGSHRIRRVDTDGVIRTYAGTGAAGYSGDGGAAADAELNTPFGVRVGAGDAVYITDSENYCVRRVDTQGTITTIAGTGVEGFGATEGAAAVTAISQTYGLAFDPDGNTYFTEDNQVRRIDSRGYMTTIAGAGYGYAGDGGPAALAVFSNPWYLAFGPDGSLYIADHSGNRVRRITPS